ncbi:MAG: NMD3-related protein [Candidatus Thermoplasmatota archaeon]|nr:NMD3-related protein [Candidatus Thermoplasmatota archaeon]
MIDCIICGKNKPFVDGICRDCLTERLKPVATESFRFERCPKCNSIKTKGRWHNSGYDFSRDSQLRSLMKIEGGASLKVEKVTLDPMQNEGVGKAQVTVFLHDDELDIREIDFSYTVRKNSCERCNRLTGSYFEATIQLRTFTRSFSGILDKALKTCIDQFPEGTSKTGSYISKVEKKKEGYDVLLGKNSDGQKISRLLKSVMPCSITETKKLNGRGDGEDLFRYTYLIRIIDLDPGSTVREKDRTCVVQKITESAVYLVDAQTMKREEVKAAPFLDRFEPASVKPEVKHYQVISRTGNETQLMNMDDFSMITLNEEIHGDTANLVNVSGNYFVL